VGTKGDRDAAMDRLLSAALRERAGASGPARRAGGQGGAPAVHCPPVEDLAAFVEGGLAASEREALETHLAACERCQDTLAAFADLPALVPQPARPSKSAWRLGRLRWALPAAAAAGALVLYLAIRAPSTSTPRADRVASVAVQNAPSVEERLQPGGGTGRTMVAEPRPAPPAAKRPASGGPQVLARPREASPPASGTATRSATSAFAETATPPNAAGTPTGTRLTALDVSKEAKAATPPAEPQVADAAGKGVAAPTTPTPLPQAMAASGGAPARAEAGARATQAPKPTVASEPVAGIVAAPRAAAVHPLGVVAESVSVPSYRRSSVPIFSPDGRIRWRLEGGGAISRSSDGGTTWQPQQSGVDDDLLAGSAPSATTCWVVGRQGTVLRSVDGEHWQRVRFPDTADLVGVEAKDGQTAVITARDGRRFATSDAGVSWSIAR
jgi:hypothetical protein